MARSQRSIQAFARVSKPSSDVVGSRKRKQIAEDEQPTPAVCKKQKFQLQTPPETPTKAIKHVLSNLKLSVPTPSALRSSKRKRAATPKQEPKSIREATDVANAADQVLPIEYDDLVSLNSCVLKALALHYAHNGVATPVDVRLLTPTVTKIWGKRKVTFDDIRTCLGIVHHSAAKTNTTFSISNYGNGKFCIEMESRQRKRGVLAQAFDESELHQAFEHELMMLLKARLHQDGADEVLKSLPRAPVTECLSYTKLKPSLAKGQQRLEEVLKPRSENTSMTPSNRPPYRQFPSFEKPFPSSSPQAQPESSKNDKENTTPPPPTANFRALSLLDRIQKKQEIQAGNAANRPSQTALDRLAALQRSEEMIQILELLATTKGPGLRASFPFPALVRSIQSSLKSPMSSEEIERCILVIGKEIAPGYAEKKEFGTMKGVVVNRMFKPDADKVREMVEAASA